MASIIKKFFILKLRNLFKLNLILFLFVNFLSIKICFGEIDNNYKISCNDVLNIMVEGQSNINYTGVVIADGTIALPLIGVVKAAGLTIFEIKNNLIKLYDADYIVDPIINVSIVKSRIDKFYIYGEVKIPKAYDITKNLTILKAIIMANGFTQYAAKNKVQIIRTINKEKKIITVRVNDIIKKGKINQDINILPEDIILVHESIF